MTPMQKTLSAARRRYRLQRMLQVLGWSLTLVVSLAILLVLVERLLGIQWNPWLYAGMVLVAVLVALVAGLRKAPDNRALASIMDDRLHLKDRLATALFVDRMEDPFAQQVKHEAQQAAVQVQLQQAFPYRWTRPWGWVLPLLAVTLGLYFTLPKDWLGLGETRARQELWSQQQAQGAEQARKELAKTVEVLQQLKGSQDLEETPAELKKSLQGLAEITQKELTSPQSRQEAAARLSEVQEKLAQQTRQREEVVQAMQSAMSRLDAGQPGPADRFAQALQRGNFAAAMKELENLSNELDNLSAEDRQALQQQLQNLARQLAQAAQNHAQQLMQQAMQDAGLSEQQQHQIQQQLQQGASTQQLAQQLQQQGMSPQQAQQLAQQLSQQHQHSQNCSQCQAGSQQISQAMQQLAQSAGSQGQQGQSGPNPQWQQGQGQMSQQLSQMAQMQQQLQQMQQAQSQMQQAMQSLGQGQGMGQGIAQGPMPWMNNPWQPQQPSGGLGQGIGGQPGGNPMGAQRQLSGYQTEAQSENTQGQGRVIASWLSQGENAAGPAEVEFNTAVREARSDAERAMTEDRVPQRYHQTIKHYFNQLPQSPEEIRQSPPPAPK